MSDSDAARAMTEFNNTVVEEFRANGGKVGPPFEGAPMLLLHSTGAKTGAPRLHPVVYQADGENYVVFGSKAGADTHPAWYHNLVANPDVTVEVGTDTVPVRARVAEGAERERIWALQKQIMPGFAEYEAKTSRQIPVVILEPAG